MASTNIEDLLECSVCLGQLDEKSRVLPCQHTFCLGCLSIIVDKKGYLQCPECRKDFPDISISNLPRNVLLVRILEGLRSRRGSSNNVHEDSPTNDNNNKLEKRSSTDTSKRLPAKVKYDALLNQPCARGLYNFTSNEPGDLSFVKGDIIALVHEIDDNWFEGILKGKRGSIPKNFVETLQPLPKIEADDIQTPYAKALYSYENKEEPELLSFREGDIIVVIKQLDRNWLEGILGGQYGIFPLNFVKLNKASQQLIESFEGSSSPSSSSNSSDEEVDKSKAHDGRCSRQRQLSRRKKIKSPWVRREYREKDTSPATSQPEGFEAAATCSSNADVEATVFDNSSSDQQVPKRPNTIHVANPAEQRRESRRALNLSDDGNQPRPRLRTRSQGRRGSATSQDQPPMPEGTFSTNRSAEELNAPVTTLAPLMLPAPGTTFTTSVSNRSTESIISSPQTNPPPLGLGEIYTALFTYSPSQDDELALIQGDHYCVVEKHLDGWYKGFHMRSRQTGVFPGNYVKPKSQVSAQLLRSINSNPSMIGYGSNPSSPITIPSNNDSFSFSTSSRNESDTAGSPNMGATAVPSRSNQESSSPARNSGMTNLFKKLKKGRSSKRQQPPIPTPPPPTLQQPQAPPSYYHSSMPAPAHHRLSRPSPLVPVEPPPPYTPTAEQSTSTVIDTTNSNITVTSNIILPGDGEKFRVIAPYPAAHESELTLRTGDIIFVTQKGLDGWYKGKSTRTGTSGVFPSIFVEPCQ